MTFAFRIGAVLLGFALHLYLARTLSLEAYGIYTYAFSVATVLAFIGRLGYHHSIIRFAANYVHQEAWGALRAFLHHARVRMLFVSILLAIVAAAIASLTPDRSNTIFYLSLVLVPLFSLASLQDGLLKGLKRPGFATAVDGWIRPGATLVFLIGAAVLGFSRSAEGAMLAMIGGSVTALVAAKIWERRFLPPQARTTPGITRSLGSGLLSPLPS